MLLLNPFEYGHGILLLMPRKNSSVSLLCSLLLAKQHKMFIIENIRGECK